MPYLAAVQFKLLLVLVDALFFYKLSISRLLRSDLATRGATSSTAAYLKKKYTQTRAGKGESYSPFLHLFLPAIINDFAVSIMEHYCPVTGFRQQTVSS